MAGVDGRRIILSGDIGVSAPEGLRVIPGRQPALVLAYLILERDRSITRDELADLLWPQRMPAHWAGAVRGVLTKIRLFLDADKPPAAIVTSRHGTIDVFLADCAQVDLEEAEGVLVSAEGAGRASKWPSSVTDAELAQVVLGRPFLPREDGSWVIRQRDRLAALHRRALLVLVHAADAEGRPDAALEHCATLLERDPFDEEAVRAAMSAHLAAGQRVQALATYEALRARLDDELGVRASLQTEALWIEMLGDAPAPPPPRSRARVTAAVAHSPPFVGRVGELATLDRLTVEARHHGARMVVVEGEAGVGKTRLLTEWVGHGAMAHVAWGRCTGARLAFEPIVEGVGDLLASDPALVTRLGAMASPLAPMFPGVVPGRTDLPEADPAQQRSLLFRAFGAALIDAAQRGGVAIVIDDAQAADDDTLDLVQYLAHTLVYESAIIALTARHSEGLVAVTLAEMARRGLRTIELGGLGTNEVRVLLAAAGVPQRDLPALAPHVRARTGGNPLYVHHLVEEAAAEGRPIDATVVPAALRELLARRLQSMSRPSFEVLALAAVIDEDISLDLLGSCSSRTVNEIADVLDDLCRQRFLDDRGDQTFGWVHTLVRDAVLQTLSPTRTARLHLRVGEALEGSTATSTIAAHYRAAGSPVADRAVRYSLESGRVALEQSAWGAAADELAAAVAGGAIGPDHVTALIGRGRAERGRGRAAAAQRYLAEALDRARDAGERRLVAEAVLALVGGGGRGASPDLGDSERASLLREALTGLVEPDDDDLVIAVCSEMALALVLTSGTESERDRLIERAIVTADRRGHADDIGIALLGRRTVLVDAAAATDRLADADRVLAFAATDLRPDTLLGALLARVEELLVLGRIAEATTELSRAAEVADSYDHPYWSWAVTTWQALITVIDGRYAEAESMAFAALAHQPDHPEAVAALGVQLVDIRLYQGRSGEMLELLSDAADTNVHIPTYRAVLALCAAASGDVDLARSAFRFFVAADFANLPRDSNRFMALAVLADTAVRLGERAAGSRLRELLEPYAELHVVLNCYGGGGAYWGPVKAILDQIDHMVAAAR